VPAASAQDAAAARHPRYDYWIVVASHALVDVFPMFIVSLMIVLQDRLALTRSQETAVWVATPIFSGLIQPLMAWLGDRYNTRLAGPLGLAMGAVCIGSIGFAQSFWQLIVLQIIGVIGIGMYHPTAAAVAGQTGTRALPYGRAFALSLFVASGMLGHTLGPIIATRVNDWFGMAHLAWIIPPTLVAVVLLHLATRDTPHRHHDHHALQAALTPAQARARWYTAALLSGQNALRFTVNTGMFILFSYWAASRIPGDPDAAAFLNGNLAAALTIGMGIGALAAGRWLRPGTEKVAFAATAFGGAFFVGSINLAGDWGQAMFAGIGLANAPAYLAAALAAVGFFATVPSSVGLGQRLLPSHTGLVTSLLLGIGWVIGALARPYSSALLGGVKLDEAELLTDAALNRGFAGFAVLLALSGVLALLMPAATIRDAARHS
jgi:FSR family fosmidomycin resistance protein-like MFS transporter